MCEVRTVTPSLKKRGALRSFSEVGRFQSQDWIETAKSLLGARTKQKIGLNISRSSVKSSSLDPESNRMGR